MNFQLSIFNSSEKGVSLIITFFILVIILAVVLSISIILYSEIKIIRNIGDSVVAFYAADSGVEKTLYYDRKAVPEGATGGKRGVCNLCVACPTDDPNCYDPNTCNISKNEGDEVQNDCESPFTVCENCTITFNTTLADFPKKTYSVKAVVSQITSPINPSAKFSNLRIYSKGSYTGVVGANEVKRAIQLDVQKDETKNTLPDINNAFINFKTQEFGYDIFISADINAHGHGVKSVTAHIYSSNYDNPNVPLLPVSGIFSDGTYTATVSGLDAGIYSADITVCDKNIPSKCYTQTNIPGI